jgi:hypothetical protein
MLLYYTMLTLIGILALLGVIRLFFYLSEPTIPPPVFRCPHCVKAELKVVEQIDGPEELSCSCNK